jgi:hypothetical protein
MIILMENLSCAVLARQQVSASAAYIHDLLKTVSSGYILLPMCTKLGACRYSRICRKSDADVEGWFVDIVVLIAANTSAR